MVGRRALHQAVSGQTKAVRDQTGAISLILRRPPRSRRRSPFSLSRGGRLVDKGHRLSARRPQYLSSRATARPAADAEIHGRAQSHGDDSARRQSGASSGSLGLLSPAVAVVEHQPARRRICILEPILVWKSGWNSSAATGASRTTTARSAVWPKSGALLVTSSMTLPSGSVKRSTGAGRAGVRKTARGTNWTRCGVECASWKPIANNCAGNWRSNGRAQERRAFACCWNWRLARSPKTRLPIVWKLPSGAAGALRRGGYTNSWIAPVRRL